MAIGASNQADARFVSVEAQGGFVPIRGSARGPDPFEDDGGMLQRASRGCGAPVSAWTLLACRAERVAYRW